MESKDSGNGDVEMGGMSSPVPAMFGSKTLEDYAFFFSDSGHRIDISLLDPIDFEHAEFTNVFAIEPIEPGAEWEIVRPSDIITKSDTRATTHDTFCRYHTNAYTVIKGQCRVILPVWRIKVSSSRVTQKSPFGFLQINPTGNKVGIHDIVIDRVGRLHDVCRAPLISPEHFVNASGTAAEPSSQHGLTMDLVPFPKDSAFYKAFFQLDEATKEKLAVAPPAVTIRDIYEHGLPSRTTVPANDSNPERFWPTSQWSGVADLTKNQRSAAHHQSISLKWQTPQTFKGCATAPKHLPNINATSSVMDDKASKEEVNKFKVVRMFGDKQGRSSKMRHKTTSNPDSLRDSNRVSSIKYDETMDFDIERPASDSSVEDEPLVLDRSTGKYTSCAPRRQSKTKDNGRFGHRRSSSTGNSGARTSRSSGAAGTRFPSTLSRPDSGPATKSEGIDHSTLSTKERNITNRTRTTQPSIGIAAATTQIKNQLINQIEETPLPPSRYSQAPVATSLPVKATKREQLLPMPQKLPPGSSSKNLDLSTPYKYAEQEVKKCKSPEWAPEEPVIEDSTDSDD